MADRDRFADSNRGDPRGDETRPLTPAPPPADNGSRLLELNTDPTPPAVPPSLAVAARQASQVREATSGAQFFADRDQRETVGAAFAFHAGQRYGPLNISTDLISRVADKWFELFGDDPAMMSAVMSDAQSIVALTDTDVADRVSKGEDLSEFGDVWDSIVEVAWEVGAKEDAVALVGLQADAVKGSFEALSIFDGFEVQQAAAAEGIKSAVMPAFEKGGVWSFDETANLLAVTIGVDENAFTVGLEPRAGFDPTDAVGVLAEVVYAATHGSLVGELEQRGVIDRILEAAQEIGEFVDGNPQLGQTIDVLWEEMSNLAVVGLVTDDEGDTGPVARARRRIEEEKQQLAETVGYSPPLAMGFPVETLIAKVTETIIREGAEQGVDIAAEDALAVAADAVQDPVTRNELKSEWWDLTKEQIIADAEAALEDQSSVRKAVESGLGVVLTGLEWWDSVAQRIGLSVIGAVGGAVEGVPAAFGGDPAEGFELFKGAMERAGSADKASDYFGIDTSSTEGAQSFGDGLNLAVGIGFDPLNFLFPGAKGARALFRKSVTDAKYADLFVRQGGVRRITKTIANTTDRKAISNVLYLASEGMSNDGIRGLVELAQSSTSTLDDVNKILLKELPGTDGVGWFLGGGPNRAIRHSTLEGVGRMYDSIGAGKLSDTARDAAYDLTMQLRRTRAIDLGENMALGNFADEVMMLFPNDPDRALEWFMRAVDATDGVSRQQKLGAAAALKQKAGDKVRAVNRHRDNTNAAVDVRGVRKNLDSVKDSLRKVDDLDIEDTAKNRIRTTLRRQARQLDDKLAEAEGRLANYSASAREANKAVTDATRFEGDMAVQPSRASLADNFHRMYDEIAVELNEEYADVAAELGVDELIPLLKDSKGRVRMNPHAPDVPMRDWSEVTGTPRGANEYLDQVRIAGGLAGDDVPLANAIDDIGMFQRQQRVLTPVSPYELMLYRRIRRNSPAYRAWQTKAAKETVGRVTSGLRLMFGMNLLMNPITMAKVTIDETLRFFAQTGALGKTVKATLAGMPGAQLAMTGLKRVGIPDATRAVTRAVGEFAPVLRKIPGWKTLENAKGTWVSNPYALQHQRSHEGFLSAAKFQWVTRKSPGVSKQGYINQAERWVNGTLMNDPIFKAYARSLPDARGLGALSPNEYPVPESFVRWWNEGDDGVAPGKTFAKSDDFIVGTGAGKLVVPIDAQFAWDTVQRGFNGWVDNLVDDGQKHVLRRRLVEAVSDRGLRLNVVDDAHLFLALKQVPGLASEGEGLNRVIGAMFNGGFGNPSARRSGVFFENFYDEAHGIYTEANRNKGRLVTKEMLVERGFPESEALEMLAHGSDNAVVRNLMDELGAVTEQQIEANAARYASMRADDLMYRFTAGSLAGQGVEAGLLFPFARAQMDFLSWWSDHLTRPLQLRQGLQKVLPDAVVNTVQTLPLNLRAISKYAHLTATLNNELESPLDEAIKKLTFFPFRFDNEFFLDVIPQAGPLPSWLIDAYSEEGRLPPEAVDALATFFPALEYADATDSWFDWIFPNSRRLLRDATAGMMRGVAQLTGKPPGQWQEGMTASVYNWLSQNRLPAATGDFTAFSAMEFLRDNALGDNQLGVPGSEEWNNTVNELTRQAALEANRVEMGQDIKDRINPVSSVDREYRSLHAYERMLGDEATFGLLADYGVLSGADVFEEDGENRLLETYDRFLSGQASDEDKTFLDDALARIFHESRRVQVADAIPDFSVMDMMLLRFPELAVNLVSKWECSGAQVSTSEHRSFHTKHCNPQTGRLDLPPGPAGSDLFQEARVKGWVANRPAFGTDASDGGWVRDAHEAVHSSAKRAVDAVWFHAVGKEWRGRVSQKDAERTVDVTPFMTTLLEPLGVEWETGSTMTGGELFSALGVIRKKFDIEASSALNLLDRGPVKQLLERNPFGQQLLDQIDTVESVLADNGVNTFEDWPEEVKQVARDQFSTAIELGIIQKADYDKHVSGLFGELDFAVSAPTGLDDVEAGLTFEPAQMRDGTVEVVDGDTLSLVTEDGPLRVRLIGVNAPEVTQPGYTESRNNLINLIRNADRIDLAIYKPELFGVTQLTAPGEERLLMWLLIDGVPIYDVSVFTSDNPRGAGVGGTVLDLNGILEAGRGSR